jgi:hypothetical protein
VAGYLIPPQNTWIGRWLMQHDVKGPRWIWGELTLYVGWITLALAFGGALVAVRGRTAQTRALRFFIVLALVALALAAGPNAREIADNRWHWSAFGVLAHIPGADLFRAPARFALLLTLAMAALAGGFCAHLHERYGRYGRIFAIVAIPFLLSEFFVVDFPGGQPSPTPIPAVYRKVAALPPAPLVSLPDYAATSAWYDEPDYQLFSTVHWRPIANGYSRAAPSDFSRRMARLSAFPNAPAIDEARHLGIRYVILHTDKYPGGPDAAERAMRAANVRLLARFRSDYLFEIQTE